MSENINLTDKLYILQCTEEVIAPGGFDKENIQSRPKLQKCCENEVCRPDSINTTDSLNRHMEQKCSSPNDYQNTICSYNNKLEFLGTGEKCSVRYLWLNLLNFINYKAEKIENKETILNFYIVTHHNRMKKHLFAFLPKHDEENGKKIGLANCSCILLNKENQTASLKMIFNGFPDKIGKYSYITDKYDFKLGFDPFLESNSDVKDMLDHIIKNNNVSIFFIRHGNALHNEPLKLTGLKLNRNVDTNLTPLGILQSRILGKYLIDNQYLYVETKEKNVNYFCASYLNRSQHTVLGLVKSLYTNFSYKGFNYLQLLSLEHMFTNLAIKRLLRKSTLNKVITKFTDFFDNPEILNFYTEFISNDFELMNSEVLISKLESVIKESSPEKKCYSLRETLLGGKRKKKSIKKNKKKSIKKNLRKKNKKSIKKKKK